MMATLVSYTTRWDTILPTPFLPYQPPYQRWCLTPTNPPTNAVFALPTPLPTA